MNILAKDASVAGDIRHLEGKRISVADIAGVERNFFAIALSKRGIDPNKDVEWLQFPAWLLGAAEPPCRGARFVLVGDPGSSMSSCPSAKG